MNKYLALDIETGGIGTDKSLLTAYFQVLDESFNVVDELDLRVKPDDGVYRITAEALGINKINLVEHDAVAISQSAAGGFLRAFLLKAVPKEGQRLIPIGHGVAFDLQFIHAHLLGKETFQKYTSYRLLDTAAIGQFLKLLLLVPETVSGSLGSFVEFYSIPPGAYHTAKGDTEMTIAVLKAMMQAYNA